MYPPDCMFRPPTRRRWVPLGVVVLVILHFVYIPAHYNLLAIGGSPANTRREHPNGGPTLVRIHALGVPAGLRQPSDSNVWPRQHQELDDRLLTQMNLIPKGSASAPTKTILALNGMDQKVRFDNCPVQNCAITGDQSASDTADVIVFKQEVRAADFKRRPLNQIWVFYSLESPHNTLRYKDTFGAINWTATYRLDSTLNTPYAKFVFYDNYTSLPVLPARNYAEGKTKKVAWFVSNCGHGRAFYAKELDNYIQVDIYGRCGPLQCERHEDKRCRGLLNNDYKFYLSFENSNCRHYITEKFFLNGLDNDVIPIVYGAHPDDYRQVAPPHSYIHVDDFDSPKHLAAYLQYLDQNDTAYNEYFRWKGTGRFINTKFWCRLCSMAHEADHVPPTWYDTFSAWWNEGACLSKHETTWLSWLNKPKI